MRHDYDCLKRPVLLSHVGLADAVSSEVGNVEGANAHFILVFSALIEFASVFTVAQIFILGRGSKVCELYRVCKYTT
jgi:hypothetical protein